MLGLCLAVEPLEAQAPESISVRLPGEESLLPVDASRGYPAIPTPSLARLGWTVNGDPASQEGVLSHRTGLELRVRGGSPFLVWDDQLIQMVDAPYWTEDVLFVPLQLVVDLFPGLLPDAYEFDEEQYLLLAEGARLDEQPGQGAPISDAGISPPNPAGQGGLETNRPGPPLGPPAWSLGGVGRAETVVIIDPGHGGDDPGTVGLTGVREKDVALGIALALARELSMDPGVEVRLTRDRDVEVGIWTRGDWATSWKEDRRGVFVSIHANALDGREGVRGFETYFLSEARTEHERRVATAENAPLSRSGGDLAPPDPMLAAILSDLRAFDHQTWSALLAEEVQRDLSEFHPGPDRGVKQAPLAVITNTLMPSVLVEVGFLTNPEEERLLSRDEFHRDAGRAIARALRRFLERYEPNGAD